MRFTRTSRFTFHAVAGDDLRTSEKYQSIAERNVVIASSLARFSNGKFGRRSIASSLEKVERAYQPAMVHEGHGEPLKKARQEGVVATGNPHTKDESLSLTVTFHGQNLPMKPQNPAPQVVEFLEIIRGR